MQWFGIRAFEVGENTVGLSLSLSNHNNWRRLWPEKKNLSATKWYPDGAHSWSPVPAVPMSIHLQNTPPAEEKKTGLTEQLKSLSFFCTLFLLSFPLQFQSVLFSPSCCGSADTANYSPANPGVSNSPRLGIPNAYCMCEGGESQREGSIWSSCLQRKRTLWWGPQCIQRVSDFWYLSSN